MNAHEDELEKSAEISRREDGKSKDCGASEQETVLLDKENGRKQEMKKKTNERSNSRTADMKSCCRQQEFSTKF
jgi:hypothetical protein